MTEYFVDVDSLGGTSRDSNPGTLSSPWKTLQHAADTAVAGDTVYLRNGVYPERVSIDTNDGTQSSPITFTNYQSEPVLVTGARGGCFYITSDYTVLDGINAKLSSVPSGYSLNVDLRGDNCIIRNMDILGHSTIPDAIAAFSGGYWEGGISMKGDYGLVENCYIRGLTRQSLSLSRKSQFNTIRNNNVSIAYNCLAVSHSPTAALNGHLIEGNILEYAFHEDGIQFNGLLDDPDDTSTRGTIIRGNIIRYNAENGIDLKGTKYILIEDNYIYGNKGNNDGGVGGVDNRVAGSGIAKGSKTSCEQVIVRNNVVFDNSGGVYITNGMRVYNNTILGNNRDFAGPNSSFVPTYRPEFAGIVGLFYGDAKIINNIIGGNNCGDVVLGQRIIYINNNLYTDNLINPVNADYITGGDWPKYTTVTAWNTLLNTKPNITGKDADSLMDDPSFVNIPINMRPYGDHTKYDFALQPGSPAINNGKSLTTAVGSGSNSTTLVVSDSHFFFDGYGRSDEGDEILVGNNVVTISSIDYATHTLTLDTAISWNNRDNIYLNRTGTSPDIGAIEYIPNDPCSGVDCPDICDGLDLWSQRCDPTTGQCIPFQLIQADSIDCKISDAVPADESTIQKYLVLGGLGFAGFMMLLIRSKLNR